MQYFNHKYPPKSSPQSSIIDCVIEPKDSKGGLYIGSIEDASNINLLKQNKVQFVLTLSWEQPIFYQQKDGITQKILQCRDQAGFGINQMFQQAHQFIDSSRSKGSILVHCMAGISRSASVVLSYLMSKENMNLQQALGHLKNIRNTVRPNPGFLRQLLLWEKDLYGGISTRLTSQLTPYYGVQDESQYQPQISSIQRQSPLVTNNGVQEESQYQPKISTIQRQPSHTSQYGLQEESQYKPTKSPIQRQPSPTTYYGAQIESHQQPKISPVQRQSYGVLNESDYQLTISPQRQPTHTSHYGVQDNSQSQPKISPMRQQQSQNQSQQKFQSQIKLFDQNQFNHYHPVANNQYNVYQQHLTPPAYPDILQYSPQKIKQNPLPPKVLSPQLSSPQVSQQNITQSTQQAEEFLTPRYGEVDDIKFFLQSSKPSHKQLSSLQLRRTHNDSLTQIKHNCFQKNNSSYIKTDSTKGSLKSQNSQQKQINPYNQEKEVDTSYFPTPEQKTISFYTPQQQPQTSQREILNKSVISNYPRQQQPQNSIDSKINYPQTQQINQMEYPNSSLFYMKDSNQAHYRNYSHIQPQAHVVPRSSERQAVFNHYQKE